MSVWCHPPHRREKGKWDQIGACVSIPSPDAVLITLSSLDFFSFSIVRRAAQCAEGKTQKSVSISECAKVRSRIGDGGNLPKSSVSLSHSTLCSILSSPSLKQTDPGPIFNSTFLDSRTFVSNVRVGARGRRAGSNLPE